MRSPGAGDSSGYLRGEILDGRFPPDPRIVRRLGRAVARLRHPWDAAFGVGVTAGLWGTAAIGAEVIVWSGGSILGVAIGLPLVGMAGGLAAHVGSLMSRA